MIKNRWSLFLISLLAITNLMCLVSQIDFQTQYYTKSEPQLEQLVGKYVPTEETISLIKKEGHYLLYGTDVSISLAPDGTFEMKDMPDWWITDFGESNGNLDAGTGTWKVSKYYDEYWGIEFEFNNFNSKNMDMYVSVTLCGEQPPYALWFYVGDPDSGPIMSFEQQIAKETK